MPALAIAAALRAAAPGSRAGAGGRRARRRGALLPTRDFRYHLLPAEPIYRRQWWKNVRWPFVAGRLLRAWAGSSTQERPVAVLGTGGYACAPVVWWAARRGIPTAIQEQNAYPGLATRWLSSRVRHDLPRRCPRPGALLRPGATTAVFDTGNPIAPPTPERRGRRPAAVRPARRTGRSCWSPAAARARWRSTRRSAGLARAAGGAGDVDVLWVTGRGHVRESSRDYHRPPDVQVIRFPRPDGRRLCGGRPRGVAGRG